MVEVVLIMKVGFDCKKYVKIQSKKIKEKVKLFDKLYLEIGGKLFYDTHAAEFFLALNLMLKYKYFRNLKRFGNNFCINANDIEEVRPDRNMVLPMILKC